MWIICKRELKGYFYSPQAYILMGFFLVLTGFLFSDFIIRSNDPSIQYAMSSWPIILLFIAPILTMKLFTEERKYGTEKLIFSSPISVYEIVLGKFLSVCLVYLSTLIFTFVNVIIVFIIGKPDMGIIFSSYVGNILLGFSFLSVGVFASSLTENQIIAGVISFGLLLFFWLSDLLQGMFSGISQNLIKILSLFTPYSAFQKGIISLSGVIYYLSFTGIFLFLTIRVIKSRWLQ
ncbi:ABC transporter permease [Defluviitalea phaphyphila]|uniref:ABC transporter permease n=1 Tax=Defluviitalea phaphyphila TaxID=1473580 RepID=UPI00073132C8|nr:ABC transporter permease [Defluviitalea phaphyphila]